MRRGLQSRLAATILAGVAGTAAADTAGTPVERGRYLTTASDCVACHTAPGGAPFAGGRAFRTPFGIIHAPNITPDPSTGIGEWTDAEFVRALRQGIGRHGEQLYPAFPYTAFTKLSDADALAIRAYLASLPPVHRASPPNRMKPPYGLRPLLRGWKLLNFREGRLTPDPARDATWNRGRYLVEALGHCGECHTPRTITMGLDTRRPLGGGVVDAWRAPDITADPKSGIGSWSRADIATYLATGRLNHRAQAAGPMAEAVEHSTRFLDHGDLAAIATYLKTVRETRDRAEPRSRFAWGQPDRDRLSFSDPGRDRSRPDGRALYAAACAACHGLDGGGLPGRDGGFPALVGNGATGAVSADNLVLAILDGVRRDGAGGTVYMPAFGTASRLSNAMSDAEVAALATYVVRQFGNPAAGPVTDAHVAALRVGETGGWTLVDMVDTGVPVVALISVALGVFAFRRRRHRRMRAMVMGGNAT